MAVSKTYRLGVIGFAHMHVNELVAQFVAHDQINLIACADTQPNVPSLTEVEGSRRANLKRTLAAADDVTAYSDYREMLDSEQFDIVIFCPEIARHAEIAEALADRRIHMLTEKPMGASLADALRMVQAARNANVALLVNWLSPGVLGCWWSRTSSRAARSARCGSSNGAMDRPWAPSPQAACIPATRSSPAR